MPPSPNGCCPICDRQVPRIRTEFAGTLREIYDCPEDGPVAYGAVGSTVAQWTSGIAGVAG